MHASVYGIVTPSSRGSPPIRRRETRSDGRLSALPSQQNTPRTSPETSPRQQIRSGASPPVSGGTASGRPEAASVPTQQESQDAASRDAYYRQSLLHLGQSNAERIASRNVAGSFRCAPTTRCVPLAEVHEEDRARGSNYRGNPTPKAQEIRRESDRKNGERVYDAANAIILWRRLRHERPSPPDQPRNPLQGFDDDAAIALEKRGYLLATKAVEVSAAASHGKWRPYVRMGKKSGGETAASNRSTRGSTTQWNNTANVGTLYKQQ